MKSFETLQENIKHVVVIELKEMNISKTSELVVQNTVNEELKRSAVKADIKSNEFMDIMYLLDCLESSTKAFQQAEYFY